MTKRGIGRWSFAFALALALGSGGAAGAASFTQPVDQLSPDGAASAYCTQVGGQLESRYPIYGSNSSENLRLYGSRTFCQFTSASDGSRIHILAATLYTTEPSLAALAYYAAPPVGSCNGNPASCYCSYLGGSDLFGGINAAGGGWYNKKSIDQTLEACIFPDMSTIDSWGLAYHSFGIVRGIDLSTVLRFPNPYLKTRH